VLLLGEVLASLAPSDEFFVIAQSCGPVESSPEGFADQRARGRVVTADALVDLLQDVLAFFTRDALREYSGRSATPAPLSSVPPPTPRLPHRQPSNVPEREEA
jgi:hypothetical protein